MIILNNIEPTSTEAPKAVIGAGTGLGEAYLTFNGHVYDVWPCEGKEEKRELNNRLEDLYVVLRCSHVTSSSRFVFSVLGLFSGGHTDFSPRNEIEFELLMYIKNREKLDRVSVERAVSGTGIPYIYDFLCTKMPGKANKEAQEKMK